jgi:hypothetical protein
MTDDGIDAGPVTARGLVAPLALPSPAKV